MFIKTIRAVIAFSFIGIAAVSQAADTKTIGGNACKSNEIPHVYGGDVVPATGAPLWNAPTPYTKTATTVIMNRNIMRFACPILRDYTTNTTKFGRLEVWVHDEAPANVSCNLIVSPVNSSGVTVAKTNGTPSPNPQTSSVLVWTASDIPNNYTGGNLAIVCNGSVNDIIGAVIYSEIGGGDTN